MAQVALVTGTSSGMGLHTAVGLAARGVQVVATMRDPAKAGALRDAATAAGVQLEVRALDVTDATGAQSCVEAVLNSYGRMDILVNNAGRGSVASLEQLTMDDLQAQLDVNYLGVAALTRLVLPHMRRAGRGRIVTVTSVGGVVGQPFADAYCGAKFAVEGLMQSLAPVAAHFGIGVSVVEPGAVASEFVANVAGVVTPQGEPSFRTSVRAIPTPRCCTPTWPGPAPPSRLRRARPMPPRSSSKPRPPTPPGSAGRHRRWQRVSPVCRWPTWTAAGCWGRRPAG